MQDLTFELTDIRDYPVPQRDGRVLNQKRAVFYLGKFGPFTEYFGVNEFTDSAMRARVDALRFHLEAMHR